MRHPGGIAVGDRATRSGTTAPGTTLRRTLPGPAARRPGRLYAIDGLRLVAALMVAVHHYVGTSRVSQPGNSVWGRPIGEVLPNVSPFAAYGWIGVEFFFVISGFVVCMSCWDRRPRDFFVSRVVRLYPAYWFAVLFTTAVLTVFPVVFHPLSQTETILNLSMLQQGLRIPLSDGVYWTLWSELRFYLVFLIVVATGLTYRKVVVFCCVWGAFAAVAPTSGVPLLVMLADPDSAWFFIAGLALYLMHRFGRDLLLWGVLGLAWVMSQHELVHRVDVEGVSTWTGSVLLYTLFLLVMVGIALGLTDRIRWRWLATAGSLTYPFYLLHDAAGLTVIHYLRDRLDARLLVGVLIGTALLLSWLVHRFVERPATRALGRGLRAAFSRLDTASER